MAFKLSLAMIVKDEAEILARVLTAAKNFCDELVVVDTGSTDDTVKIAESFGAKVPVFKWIDDFAAARNFAFSQCTGDWIIWLDADDVVPEATQQKIIELKQSDIAAEVDTITCSYHIAFDAEGNVTSNVPRERIIRRDSRGRWECPIHETFVQPEDSFFINRLDIVIEHRKPAVYVERSSDRNLILLEKLIAKGDRSPRVLYYHGRELLGHDRFAEAIPAFEQHLAVNSSGDSYAYQSAHAIMRCYMTLAEQHQAAGDTDAASEALESAVDWGYKAVQMNPSRAEALVDLGVIYYRCGRFDAGISVLTAATVSQKPKTGLVSEADYTWRPWHYLSLCYEGIGEFQRAIHAADQALPTIPDKATVEANIECFKGKLSG